MILSTIFLYKWPPTTICPAKDCVWSSRSSEKSIKIPPDHLVSTIQMSWISHWLVWTSNFGETSQILEKILRKSKTTRNSNSSTKSTVNTPCSTILPQTLMWSKCSETNSSKQEKTVFLPKPIRICHWSFWIRIWRETRLSISPSKSKDQEPSNLWLVCWSTSIGYAFQKWCLSVSQTWSAMVLNWFISSSSRIPINLI